MWSEKGSKDHHGQVVGWELSSSLGWGFCPTQTGLKHGHDMGRNHGSPEDLSLGDGLRGIQRGSWIWRDDDEFLTFTLLSLQFRQYPAGVSSQLGNAGLEIWKETVETSTYMDAETTRGNRISD